jgi:hypothetical protein
MGRVAHTFVCRSPAAGLGLCGRRLSPHFSTRLGAQRCPQQVSKQEARPQYSMKFPGLGLCSWFPSHSPRSKSESGLHFLVGKIMPSSRAKAGSAVRQHNSTAETWQMTSFSPFPTFLKP